MIKNLPANSGDVGSISGLGRSPRGGNDTPVHYFLPGESHRQEPGRLSSMGLQRVRHN